MQAGRWLNYVTTFFTTKQAIHNKAAACVTISENYLRCSAPQKIAVAESSVNFGWRGGAPNFFPAAAAWQGVGWRWRRNLVAEGSTAKPLQPDNTSLHDSLF